MTLFTLIAAGCSRDSDLAPKKSDTTTAHAGASPASPDSPAGSGEGAATDGEVVRATNFATAVEAIKSLGLTAKVIGVGEIHEQTGQAERKRSALASFREHGLPAFATAGGYVVVETWRPNRRCGEQASATTAAIETTVRRPAQTKNELTEFANAIEQLSAKPVGMELSCLDYERLGRFPAGSSDQIAAMLDITTAQLAQQANVAFSQRSSANTTVVIYGGAMHNDVEPAKGLAQWSYVAKLSAEAAQHYVEIDWVPWHHRNKVLNLAAAIGTTQHASKVWWVVKRAKDQFTIVVPDLEDPAPPEKKP